MDIERGASNTFLVPARELETHYLLVFQNMDDPTNYQRAITTNTGPSSSPLMLTVVETNNATAVTRETAQAGDLAYYPGHVMMYLGIDNAIIHAPFTGRNVEVDFISKSRVNSVRFGNPMG